MNFPDLRPELNRILEANKVVTLLQPILDMVEGSIAGYEALTRGPSDSPLHSPEALFKVGAYYGRLLDLDLACSNMAFATFARLKLPGRLFVNLTPGSLLAEAFSPGILLERLTQAGLDRRQLVFEITESSPDFNYGDLKHAVELLRASGLEVAMDDLGEGFSSLRLWSELKPAYVKIDKHFISGIHQDPHKLQFVRSIQQLAEDAHALVIAEGVETQSELAIIKTLNIRYAQGYLIGRPSPTPARLAPPEVLQNLVSGRVSVFPTSLGTSGMRVSAERLVILAPCVNADTPSHEVLDLMLSQPDLHAIAVIQQGRPVGIIHRPALLDRFISMFGREIYGKKPCSDIMDADPLVVDKSTQIQDLSELVVRKGKEAFTQGFIITSEGGYLGLGSGFDLMREVSQMQIVAARYANPLTGLAGNVPIQEHLERLLLSGQSFVAAYFDLDQFKPFNDVYGFRRGDDIIRMVARLMTDETNPELDFVGHIGGDDFVVLFQSPDWRSRCECILGRFDHDRLSLFNAEHIEAGGYRSEDRRGNMDFHPLVSLSIGAVEIDPAYYLQYQEVVSATAEAKRMAKRTEGSCLFVDQRKQPFTRRGIEEATE
jgi:EAL domain-containing protein (putative c-di-GMP-specific phosphodiesterase class I)/GGDEF domain-containing protein